MHNKNTETKYKKQACNKVNIILRHLPNLVLIMTGK